MVACEKCSNLIQPDMSIPPKVTKINGRFYIASWSWNHLYGCSKEYRKCVCCNQDIPEKEYVLNKVYPCNKDGEEIY